MPPATAPDRRNVKSSPQAAADAHERAKDFLTPGEIEALLEATRAGRHGVRDHLLVLMMYRHGLRVSEAVGLRRDEVDLDQARLWVKRLKNGLSVEQPITGAELRAIKRYLATRSDGLPWLFISERGQPLTRQSVNYLVGAAAERAGLGAVHPHMLRHSCGFYLANQGLRSTPRPGLPGPSRPQAHGPLHPRGRQQVRGALAVRDGGQENTACAQPMT